MNKHDEKSVWVLICLCENICSCLWVLTSPRTICKLEFVLKFSYVSASTYNLGNKIFLFQVLIDINDLTLMLNNAKNS